MSKLDELVRSTSSRLTGEVPKDDSSVSRRKASKRFDGIRRTKVEVYDFIRTVISFTNDVPFVSWTPNLNTNGEVRGKPRASVCGALDERILLDGR